MRSTILPSWSINLSGLRPGTGDPKEGPTIGESSAPRQGEPNGEEGEKKEENLPPKLAASATKISSTPDSHLVRPTNFT